MQGVDWGPAQKPYLAAHRTRHHLHKKRQSIAHKSLPLAHRPMLLDAKCLIVNDPEPAVSGFVGFLSLSKQTNPVLQKTLRANFDADCLATRRRISAREVDSLAIYREECEPDGRISIPHRAIRAYKPWREATFCVRLLFQEVTFFVHDRFQLRRREMKPGEISSR